MPQALAAAESGRNFDGLRHEMAADRAENREGRENLMDRAQGEVLLGQVSKVAAHYDTLSERMANAEAANAEERIRKEAQEVLQ